MAGIWKEFKQFAVKGNVMDMAVGIMIGGAFTTVVKSVVDDLVMPPIGLLTGGIDLSDQFVVLQAGSEVPGPYATVAAAREAGAVLITYGNFVNNVVSFLIVAVVLFLAVKWINSLRNPDTPPAPSSKACPYCKSVVHKDATRCPSCTSDLGAPAA